MRFEKAGDEEKNFNKPLRMEENGPLEGVGGLEAGTGGNAEVNVAPEEEHVSASNEA